MDRDADYCMHGLPIGTLHSDSGFIYLPINMRHKLSTYILQENLNRILNKMACSIKAYLLFALPYRY